MAQERVPVDRVVVRRARTLQQTVLPIASVAARLAHDSQAAGRLATAMAEGNEADVKRQFQSLGVTGVTYRRADPKKPQRGGTVNIDIGPVHIHISWSK